MQKFDSVLETRNEFNKPRILGKGVFIKSAVKECARCQTAGVRTKGHIGGKCPFDTPPTTGLLPIEVLPAESRFSDQPVGGNNSFDASFDVLMERVNRISDGSDDVNSAELGDKEELFEEMVEREKEKLEPSFHKFVALAQFSGTSNPEGLRALYEDAIKYVVLSEEENSLRALIEGPAPASTKAIFEHVLDVADKERERVLEELCGQAHVLGRLRETATSDDAVVKNSDIDPETFIYGQSVALNSTIRTSELKDNAAVTGRSVLSRSVVSGEATVTHNSEVSRSKIYDAAFVSTAIVDNCEIGGSTIMCEVWDRKGSIIYPTLERFGDEWEEGDENSDKRYPYFSKANGLDGQRHPNIVVKNVKLERGFIGQGARILDGSHVKTWLDENTGVLWTAYNTNVHPMKLQLRRTLFSGVSYNVGFTAIKLRPDGAYELYAYREPSDRVLDGLRKHGTFGETRR